MFNIFHINSSFINTCHTKSPDIKLQIGIININNNYYSLYDMLLGGDSNDH